MKNKYRVTTDLFREYNKGDRIQAVDMNGKGFPCLRSDIKCIDERIIERNPDWFEKVEQVQEGQYWRWNDTGLIFRIQEVDGALVDYKYIGGTKVNNVRKDDVTRNTTKLSTDEIEQALIKEAKRRFRGNVVKAINTGISSKWNLDNVKWEYIKDKDQLWLSDCALLYNDGEWAEIVDKKQGVDKAIDDLVKQIRQSLEFELVDAEVRLVFNEGEQDCLQRVITYESIAEKFKDLIDAIANENV